MQCKVYPAPSLYVEKTSPIFTPSSRSEKIRRCAIAAEENENTKKKTHNQRKKRHKIAFSDLRNPHKNFTPLFGEVAKFRTHTEKEEQQSRDGDKVERCLPQNN